MIRAGAGIETARRYAAPVCVVSSALFFASPPPTLPTYILTITATRFGSRRSHQVPCLAESKALFDKIAFKIRFPCAGWLAKTDCDESPLPGGTVTDGTMLGRHALLDTALLGRVRVSRLVLGYTGRSWS